MLFFTSCCSSERARGTWLTWLERLMSRFYTAVSLLCWVSCAQNPPFCPWAVKHVVFAKDLAGIVRWQRSGLLRGVAGGTFAACCSELLFTVVLRELVEKGILRHSGKRPPSECTICFTSCMLGPSCGVSPHVFQKGRTIEVLVGSQTRLGQY